MDEEREPRPKRRWKLRIALGLGGLVVVGVLLVGWNRVASSPSFCNSCHAMEPAVASAGEAVHRQVPCLTCHSGSGLGGSLAYIPDLVREGVQEVTPFDAADGILPSKSCTGCHANVRATPAEGELHPAAEPGSCATCHGDTTHPGASPAPAAGDHPDAFFQTHGRDAVEAPASCQSCHQQERFCVACHFRSTFPHGDDWIPRHGEASLDDREGCSLCHASTFCVACHGAEIPHRSTWLGEHWRALEGSDNAAPCLVCHPQADCIACHVRHGVHREQDLYGPLHPTPAPSPEAGG